MRGNLMRELGGWASAALLAVITVAQVAQTARAELLFRDGDSLVVALLVRSIAAGSSFDWAMSSVLFIPEAIVFGLLWILAGPLGVDVVLAAAAVCNLVALYGALRFTAGRRRAGGAPVAWSLVAMAVFCLLAATETSPSRDALEGASMLLTTTYYSATAVAVVLSVGVIRRAFDRAGLLLPVMLGVVAAISTLSNPLFAAWATAPIMVILGIAAVYPDSRRRSLTLIGWLFGGTVAGLIGRIPLSAWIMNDGAGYAQPGLWTQSARYYGKLFGERLGSPLGVIGALVVVALLMFAVRQALRARDAGARFVACATFAVPLLVVVGAIALGTHAARYLEPVFFAPVLALTASPRSVSWQPRPSRAATAAAAVVLLVGVGLSIPRIAAAAERPNPDLDCVTGWVNDSGLTGAGQFWTVRLPKLHLDDPAQLVQVDHRLNAYAWLVNRADFAVNEVSFLIEDSQTAPWALGTNVVPGDVISCGQYTIYDFSGTPLPLGPARS